MRDEVDFIEALKKKQDWALQEIVTRYLPVVKPVVSKILLAYGGQGLVEECINDIFFSCWCNADKFTGNTVLEFKKWIYKIAKYKAIDYYRKAAGSKEIPLEKVEIGNSIFSAEDTCVKQENKRQLIKWIGELGQPDKNIFIMKYFWGETSEKIAERLGITQSAVDNRLYRGRLKLGKKHQKMEVL